MIIIMMITIIMIIVMTRSNEENFDCHDTNITTDTNNHNPLSNDNVDNIDNSDSVINDNSMTLLAITILISHDQTHDNKIIRMIIRMIRTTNNHGLMVMMTMMNVYSTHSCTFNAW